MSRHLLRAAAAGVVALLAGLWTAPSASADIRIFPDVGGHITGVRVSHGPTPSRVRVAVGGYYDENPDVVDWAPGERRLYPWVNR